MEKNRKRSRAGRTIPAPAPVVAEAVQEKVKHKRYWVEVEGCGETIFFADAPARKGYDEKVLCAISDCETWDDIEVFHNGGWRSGTLRAPPHMHIFEITAKVSVRGVKTPDEALRDLQRQYGSDAVVKHISSKCLADD